MDGEEDQYNGDDLEDEIAADDAFQVIELDDNGGLYVILVVA